MIPKTRPHQNLLFGRVVQVRPVILTKRGCLVFGNRKARSQANWEAWSSLSYSLRCGRRSTYLGVIVWKNFRNSPRIPSWTLYKVERFFPRLLYILQFLISISAKSVWRPNLQNYASTNGANLQRISPSVGGLAFHNLRFGQMSNYHVEIVDPGSFFGKIRSLFIWKRLVWPIVRNWPKIAPKNLAKSKTTGMLLTFIALSFVKSSKQSPTSVHLKNVAPFDFVGIVSFGKRTK